MFFKNFKIKTVFITLLNTKTPIYSFVFSVRWIQISSLKKTGDHLILETFSKANVVVKKY